MQSGFWPFWKNFLHISFIWHGLYIVCDFHHPKRICKLLPQNPGRQKNCNNGPFHLTFLSLGFFICKSQTGAVNTKDRAEGIVSTWVRCVPQVDTTVPLQELLTDWNTFTLALPWMPLAYVDTLATPPLAPPWYFHNPAIYVTSRGFAEAGGVPRRVVKDSKIHGRLRTTMCLGLRQTTHRPWNTATLGSSYYPLTQRGKAMEELLASS
jgi:hypothetical protein